MDSSPRFRLTLLGAPLLAGSDGTVVTGGAAQRHRLALLAILARSPDQALGREILMARLWPETDLEQARNRLKVSVYALRQTLGEGAIASVGDVLRLDLGVVEVDTHDFETALERGDLAPAVELYRGPFMDGFFLKESPEFDRWIDGERASLASSYAKALEALAKDARSRGDLAEAVDRWKARAAHDPYDSRVAASLMEALATAGNKAGALRHAAIHARLLADELGLEPPAEVNALAERIRSEPDIAARTEAVAPEEPLPPPSLPSPVTPPEPLIGRRPAARWAVPTLALLAVGALLVVRPWARPSAESAEEIARAVVREMGADPPSQRTPTTNVTAWELYQRAAQPEMLRSDSTAREALSLVQRAAELDPSFAGAHASVARLIIRVGPASDPDMPMTERLRSAASAAAKAVGLDPSSAEAYATLGIAEMQLYEFAEAEAHLRRSVELDPRTSRWREWLAQLLVWSGRYDEGLSVAQGAFSVDPLSASGRAEVARGLMLTGRCDEALATLEPLRDLQPPLLRAGPIAAQCHGLRGMWDEAVEDVSTSRLIAGERGAALSAYFLARAGRRDEAQRLLDQILDAYRGEGAFYVAVVYAGLGDADQAMTWLDRSVDDHSITFEIREPAWAELKTDPRFLRTLDRMGLRE